MAAKSACKTFDYLPDSVVLEVFRYLTLKELCQIRRVCKTWKRIGSDRSLWRTVNLCSYTFDLCSLRRFITSHLSDFVNSFHITGSVKAEKASHSWPKSNISDALLRDLGKRCPKLEQLEISYGNFTGIDLNSFPSTIQTLLLTHSLIPYGWFKPLAENNVILSKLIHLDLTESRKLADADLTAICQSQRGLIILKLNGCYRLTSIGMKAIMHLNDLVILEMSHTRCDDLLLHHLCRANKKLEELNVSFCKEIHNHSVESLATLPCLKLIHLAGCDGITDQGIHELTKGNKILLRKN